MIEKSYTSTPGMAAPGWPLTAYGRYPEESKLVVPLCHFTGFALVGDTNRIYLPIVLRNP